MVYIDRAIEAAITKALSRGKSVLLLGPRQTGKTTLVKRQVHDLHINFITPGVRQRFEQDPNLLAGELEALKTKIQGPPRVILDEVQKVPEILDVVQDLIDRDVASFILTGSSARKLRQQGQANLLPGRVVSLRLDALCLDEVDGIALESLLLDGSLPGMIAVKDPDDRETDLASYVTTYLEEEVRAEALVRKLGPFARFLEYAAADSGRLINAHKLSQEIGVSHPTIQSYFQILEDCLIIERLDPVTRSQTRKKLIRGQKYLFFDLGVRRLAAREGRHLPRESMGHLFEQFIGLELLRIARSRYPQHRLRFWRDPDGPEVDWILDTPDGYVPVEVKWTDKPTINDARHIHVFLEEYPGTKIGYILCQAPRPIQLSATVLALPWQEIQQVFV